jgi:hypothetical protein
MKLNYLIYVHLTGIELKISHPGANNHYSQHTLPLHHWAIIYQTNLCYICNLLPYWVSVLHWWEIGLVILYRDWFFNVNSTIVLLRNCFLSGVQFF